MESLQPTRDPVKEPGMDEDKLGVGSTQSTVDTSAWGSDRDKPFWKALTSNVKNLHAVVSGHAHRIRWIFKTRLGPRSSDVRLQFGHADGECSYLGDDGEWNSDQ
ncbi:hypothetical protein FRC01_007483 [Tulasnella sp. 417]|nr:hypothetical protein FRC01_007483 [Tulasnella sp. 417]